MPIIRSRHYASAALLAAALILIPGPSATAVVARGNCVDEASAGPLPSGPSSPGWQGIHDVSPTGPYWSIVAGRGAQGSNVGVALYHSPFNTCGGLDQSAFIDDRYADWVALDNNAGRLPVQAYAADFFADSGPGQFLAGSKTLSTTEPGVKQSIGWGSDQTWIADIRDVHLTGGTTYTIKVVGGFSGLYLLHSKTNDPSTWTYNPTTASAKLELPKQTNTTPFVDVLTKDRTATLTFKDVNIDAWYGLVVARDGWWGNAVTVQISATAT